MSVTVSQGVSIVSAGHVYVKAAFFETINSGTTGTVSNVPKGGEILLDAFGGGVDAVISGITSGVPDYTVVKTGAGTPVSTTFDASGNYTLSGTPSSYPVAIIYYYQVRLFQFDSTKCISDFEFTGTLGVESVNGQVGVVTLDLNDINDVTAPSPSTGDVIEWSGSAWVSAANSSFLTVSETDLQDATYYYYGGLDSQSNWAINRYLKTDLDTVTTATQTNNPGTTTLASAWSSRLTLTYA